MKTQGLLGIALLFMILLGSAGAYSTTIRTPAVLVGQYSGVLTPVTLNVTPGNGTVEVIGPAEVNDTTTMSAQTAVQYATSYVGVNESRYNFTYTISYASNVSGPSAGLALTILAISALQQRQIMPDFTTTGTISANGSVGPIGGVYDKVQAASRGNLSFILVPSTPNVTSTLDDYELYYIAQQEFGIPVVPVSNVTEALKYAYGEATPKGIDFNMTVPYYASMLQPANISCTGCNTSAFVPLVNYTFNTTQSEINSIPSQFASLKAQMQGQLNQYAAIQQKGYLYSASDFAFLDYLDAFTIVNAVNITKASTTALIDNASSYCSSLVAPQMTNTNYEYVIGGELRQSWGEIYAGYASNALNASQTSDDLISAESEIGKSVAWCGAANKMFSIAVGLGGKPVQGTNVFNANVTTIVNSVAKGTGFYPQSAIMEYKAGNYAAALYATAYVIAFESPQLTGAEYNQTYSNVSTYTNGIWPSQFALQAQLYLAEAGFASSNASKAQSYTESGYSTAVLARLLNGYNTQISGSFDYNVVSTGAGSVAVAALSQQVVQLQQQVQTVYLFLLIVVVLLFIALIGILMLLLKGPKEKSASPAMPKPSRARTKGSA